MRNNKKINVVDSFKSKGLEDITKELEIIKNNMPVLEALQHLHEFHISFKEKLMMDKKMNQFNRFRMKYLSANYYTKLLNDKIDQDINTINDTKDHEVRLRYLDYKMENYKRYLNSFLK